VLRFSLIGAGNLGTNLAYTLQKKGHSFIYTYRPSRYKEFRGEICPDLSKLVGASDVIFICTQESKISGVARDLSRLTLLEGKVFFHTSNSLDSGELKSLKEEGAQVASFSPLQTFSSFDPGRDLFKGIYFLSEGDDAALDIARELAGLLGAHLLKVKPGEKKDYHMAAISSANFLVAVLKFAELRLDQTGSGIGLPVLMPLVKQTLENIEKNGVSASLTGPVKRKEFNLIDYHLSLLKGKDAELYRTLTDYLEKYFLES